jgi:hypothetical protein
MNSSRRFLRDGVGLIKNLENRDTAKPPPNLALARDMLRAPCLRAPENNWAILRIMGPKRVIPSALPKEMWRQEAAFKQRPNC